MPVDLVWGSPMEDKQTTQLTDEFVEMIRDNTEAAYELAGKHLQVAAKSHKNTL